MAPPRMSTEPRAPQPLPSPDGPAHHRPTGPSSASTSRTGSRLAGVVHDSGVPAGVFNLVTGLGPDVGNAISTHPLIDMVSFTGANAAGKSVAAAAAASVKRVALELGGKSANVILDDLDDEGFA